MAQEDGASLERASQALVEPERMNHSQALLPEMAALRATRPRSTRSADLVDIPLTVMRSLMGSRALRRSLRRQSRGAACVVITTICVICVAS